jgi:hypothetical protein
VDHFSGGIPAPSVSLPWLFDIDGSGINTQHIFRAIMGLYLALVCFWIAGALNTKLRLSALWSLVIFMMGLGLGRLASLIIDGWPHPLLVNYMLLEFIFAYIGWRLLQAATGVEEP